MSPELESLIRTEIPTYEGWTSVERCLELAELILTEKPPIFVDIGCFAGRVSISAALAMRELRAGIVVAVDPWNTDECVANESQANADWWKQVPLEELRQKFMGHLRRLRLTKWCVPMQCTSQEASRAIQSAGMVSIDGNHTEALSLLDAELWLPKIPPGGVCLADDLDWHSDGVNTTAKMKAFIDERCERIGGDTHYGIWRKR